MHVLDMQNVGASPQRLTKLLTLGVLQPNRKGVPQCCGYWLTHDIMHADDRMEQQCMNPLPRGIYAQRLWHRISYRVLFPLPSSDSERCDWVFFVIPYASSWSESVEIDHCGGLCGIPLEHIRIEVSVPIRLAIVHGNKNIQTLIWSGRS